MNQKSNKSYLFDMDSFVFASIATIVLVIFIISVNLPEKVVYCDIYHSDDFIVRNIDKETIKTSEGYIRYEDENENLRIFSVPTGYAVLCH